MIEWNGAPAKAHRPLQLRQERYSPVTLQWPLVHVAPAEFTFKNFVISFSESYSSRKSVLAGKGRHAH